MLIVKKEIAVSLRFGVCVEKTRTYWLCPVCGRATMIGVYYRIF